MKKEIKIAAPEGIDEVLNRDDLLNEIDSWKEDDLDSTRYLILIGIRKDGSAYYRATGYISPLELDAIPIAIERVCSQIGEDIAEINEEG